MLFFENDYSVGAHEKVLEALIKTNGETLKAYGNDPYSLSAKEKIKKACDCPDAEVYFLTGGTQTNKTVIDALLNKYDGVIAANSGHIALHEAGAIESAGHKVITVKGKDGKLMADDVKSYLQIFFADPVSEHMVQPGMVYISHPTEYGTLYSKEELSALSKVCREYDIPLFLDGARLGYALAVDGALTLPEIASLCDVFYIGGTKCGTLSGEAVVFTKNNLPRHFLTSIKQNGALSAKGRLQGVQFDALFTDGLYFEISKNAIRTAERLKKAFKEKGYRFFLETPTNQIFIVLENAKMKKLEEKVVISFWERFDDSHSVVRFATSWATKDEDIDTLISLL